MAHRQETPFKQYIQLVAELSDPVCVVSLCGMLEFMNTAFKKVVGYDSIEELTAQGGFETVCPDARLITAVKEAILGNEKWEGHTRLYPKIGNDFSIFMRAVPLLNDHQKVIGAAYFLKDVYVLKTKEEYLHLLEPFAENANDAVMITEADLIDEPGPRIVYVNAAFTHITGYEPEEVLGRSPRMLQGPNTDRRELDKIRAALESKQTAKVELINYRKDGQEFWVDFSLVPVADSRGVVTHFVSIQRDTTQKRLTQQALLQSQLELQKALQANQDILDHTLDVICALNQEGRFVHVNQASEAIWGYKPEELVGCFNTNFIHADDLEASVLVWENSREQGANYTFENRYIHKDGHIVFMMWRGAWSASNQLAYVIGRDISELKAAEAHLKQSEQLYRTLVNNFPNGTITILNRDYKIDFIGGKGLEKLHLADDFYIGKPITEWMGESSANEIVEKIAPTFLGNSVSFEIPFQGGYHTFQTVTLSAQQIMLVSHDISARKKVEKELQHTYLAQQRLASMQSAILDALPAPIALVNAKGIIMTVNGAWKAFAKQNEFQHPSCGVGEDYLRICDTAKGANAEEAPLVAEGIRAVISGSKFVFSLEYPCHSPV
ncbi:MAG: PAS domain S-box protein, partial [Bacteroidota bacterium]